jgi:hypothetical protein
MICQKRKKRFFSSTNKPVAVVREYHLTMLIFLQYQNPLQTADVEIYCLFPMVISCN